MPVSEEVTSRRRPPVKEFTEEDLESVRLDTIKRKQPERYQQRLAEHKLYNHKAYDREMKKQNIATSTCESRTPAPSPRETRSARVKNGPFIRRLEDVPENEPSGARLHIYPAGRGNTSKAPKAPASSDMEISSEEEEEDDEGDEDAVFVKRKRAPPPPRKPESEYQIKCFHCKSYLLLPRSQMRRITPPEGHESSTVVSEPPYLPCYAYVFCF